MSAEKSNAPLHFVKSKQNKAVVAEYPLTDCGNAERLVDQHGDGIRFCRSTNEWYAWDGSAWNADSGSATQLAKKTVRSIRLESNLLLKRSAHDSIESELLRRRADMLARWATRSESSARISGMLRMAQSDPRVAIGSDDLDSYPWLINLRNGTLELDSGRFREHRPEELLTKVAGVEYQPDAKCPRWEQFLNEVFEPHPDVIPFIQRAVGYSLTGDIREECIVVLHGAGRNGKSTLLHILHLLFGGYGGVAEIDAFLSSSRSGPKEDIADMRGRRFISAQEPMMNGAFAGSTIKWISGGDRLRARRLYEHSKEFHPTHKLWLAVNQVPRLDAEDGAAWSRLRVVPFDVSFLNRENRNLRSELRNELSGILMWAIQGCALWQRSGLGVPLAIQRATEVHRRRTSA